MSPLLLANIVLVVLIAMRVADIYGGEHYVCPSCGTRSERGHSSDCPWGRPPPG
jgi:hypothetical protein